MRVQLRASLQVKQGEFITPGIYTDQEEELHPKILELVESKSRHIYVLDDNPATRRIVQPKNAEATTANDGAKDTTTDAPAPAKRSRKRK